MIKYDTLCEITTKDGKVYKAKLKHPNPKYTRNAPDYWRREEDVPKKQRNIRRGDVAEWWYV